MARFFSAHLGEKLSRVSFDYIYVEGKLVSSTYQKEYGEGKNKITVPQKSLQVKAEAIRKLHHAKATKAEHAPPPVEPPTPRPGHVSRFRFSIRGLRCRAKKSIAMN